MKQLLTGSNYKNLVTFLLLSFMQLFAYAQDTTSKTVKTTTETSTTWYTQPWVWIVGGAVLLIILVALLRGGSSTTRDSTTVIKD
jgi:hypothetical protein